MTLIVAAIDANKVWMVTDTAMTDPLEGLRSRSYIQKIEPALDHRGLVAFAGDVHSGTKASREVSGLSAATPALEVLEAASAANAVDFLFARSAGNGPQLWKISAGHAVSVTSTDHIGSHEGFEAFQRVRNGGPAEAPSLSIMTLVSALQCDDPTMDSDVPKGLGTALQAMLFQFASQSERDFGGWPLGYVLTPKGTAFCSYCFNTSDPILGFSIPGAVVPHGSAVAGGFTLSVTELPAQNGTVAYWLQRPGGCVMLKSPEWYGVHWFSGSPTEFVEEIASKLAIKPTLWISDKSAGAPEQIHVLHGEDGLPSMAIGVHPNRALTFSVLNVEGKFHSEIVKNFFETAVDGPLILPDGYSIDFQKHSDGLGCSIRFSTEAKGENELNLTTGNIDDIIERLTRIRAELQPPVSREPAPPPRSDAVTVDPIWRSELTVVSKKVVHPLPGCEAGDAGVRSREVVVVDPGGSGVAALLG